jgi:hypothetical protein
VRNDTLRGHCDCAFYINHPRIDYTDVAALCAPRPVLVQSGQQDWIYPPEGYRPLGEKAKRIWALHGAEAKFAEQDVDARHEDLLVFRTEAFRWFGRWLNGGVPEEPVAEVEEFPKERLRAVRGPLPPDVRNASIAESFPGPWVSKPPATLDEWKARAESVSLRLESLSFPAEPRGFPDLRPEFGAPEEKEGFISRTGRISPEEGFTAGIVILRRETYPAGPKRVLVVVGSAPAAPLRAAARHLPVLRVLPRGMGGESWGPECVKFLRRAAPLVGRSLGSMQTSDVLAAVAHAREALGAERVVLCGRDEGAMLALLASLRPAALPVERVILESVPDSVLAEPILLNVARYTDAAELLSIAVPRGLVFMGRSPLGFGRAQETARLLGRPGLAIRAASLEEAVDEVLRGVP